jgi:predicted dehydrogenase
MSNSLKVGIIGASAGGGWAKISHVPAVQALAGLELAAVATNSQKSADAAARAFGVKGYAGTQELFRDPEIDIVTVAVRVPAHRELVHAAAAAGKHLYCEWPLALDLAETQELAAVARAANIKVALGLQTRTSPALLRARELIASDRIGRVLSARMHSGTIAFGPQTDEANAYLEDEANGATLVSIHGGHAIDAAIAVLGALGDIAALTTIQFPEVLISGTGERRARSIPDHLLTQSRLQSGAALSIEVAGGRAPKPTFRFEVIGDGGVLILQGGALRGFQTGRLALLLNGEQQRLDEGEVANIPDEAANVAGIYAALRDDIRNGTSTAPDFEHAVRLTRLMDDIIASSRTGQRRAAADWPTH